MHPPSPTHNFWREPLAPRWSKVCSVAVRVGAARCTLDKSGGGTAVPRAPPPPPSGESSRNSESIRKFGVEKTCSTGSLVPLLGPAAAPMPLHAAAAADAADAAAAASAAAKEEESAVKKALRELATLEVQLKRHTATYKSDQKALFRDKIIGKLDAKNKSAAAREHAAAAKGEEKAYDDMPALDDSEDDDDGQ